MQGVSAVAGRDAGWCRVAAGRRTGVSWVSLPTGLQARRWKRSVVATAPPARGKSRLEESRSTR